MVDKYKAKMPVLTLRVLNAVIRLVGWGSMIAAFVLALLAGTRPASEMPWYFWVLVLFYYLGILYTPPARPGTAPTEIRTGTARLQLTTAAVIMGITTSVLFFLPLTGMTMIILGIALANAKGSAQIMLKKREQSNHPSASS
jgi:hypothetical protein